MLFWPQLCALLHHYITLAHNERWPWPTPLATITRWLGLFKQFITHLQVATCYMPLPPWLQNVATLIFYWVHAASAWISLHLSLYFKQVTKQPELFVISDSEKTCSSLCGLHYCVEFACSHVFAGSLQVRVRVRFPGDSKLPISKNKSENGCLSLCVSPASDRQPVPLYGTSARLQPPHNPNKDKRKKMDGFNSIQLYLYSSLLYNY